jgi:acyl phosphate:glycerol-3-phosphate acyltransferase
VDYLYSIGAVLLAYLLGSVSFAVLISRAVGLKDPRTYGSLNPGATNVLRSGNKGAAVATLLLDGLKGWLPVVLIKWFGSDYGLAEGTMAAAGFAAFVGHLYPVFFGFKGGKGVATAFGVVIGFEPLLGLSCAAVWALVVGVSRYVSLASMVAAGFAPVLYLLADRGPWYAERGVLLALFMLGLLLIVRHRDNIGRLVGGTESKLGAAAKKAGK